MSCRLSPSALLILPLALALGGCPTNGTSDDDDVGDHVCGDVTRAMEYVAGLEAVGTNGSLTATLHEASPAPPDVGDNAWMVAVTDGAAPMAGCTADVSSFMPDHGHGAAAEPSWTEDTATIGLYAVDGMDLFMPGYWEITLDLDCAGTTDSIVYGFCAEG